MALMSQYTLGCIIKKTKKFMVCMSPSRIHILVNLRPLIEYIAHSTIAVLQNKMQMYAQRFNQPARYACKFRSKSLTAPFEVLFLCVSRIDQTGGWKGKSNIYGTCFIKGKIRLVSIQLFQGRIKVSSISLPINTH